MTYDINDPYRALYDPETAELLFGPRVANQVTAAEREEAARAARQAESYDSGGGIYRPPFGAESDEPLVNYAFRLHQALTERDQGKLATCTVDGRQFRINESATAPVFCGDTCYSRAVAAARNESRGRSTRAKRRDRRKDGR